MVKFKRTLAVLLALSMLVSQSFVAYGGETGETVVSEGAPSEDGEEKSLEEGTEEIKESSVISSEYTQKSGNKDAKTGSLNKAERVDDIITADGADGEANEGAVELEDNGKRSVSSNLESGESLTAEGTTTETVGDYTLTYEGTTLKQATGTGESLVIPDGTTIIGARAFENNTYIKNITFPESLITIGDHAFWNCTSLTEITLPTKLQKLGSEAFRFCTALHTVNRIPKTLEDVQLSTYGPFSGCSSLKTVTFGDGILRIPSYLFEGSGLETVEIPNTVLTIGKSSFGNTLLKSISIPDSVTAIESNAFYNCQSLEKVEISNGSELTVIGAYAFQNNISLSSVNFPESLITIDDCAFNYCTSLPEITLPSKLQNLGTTSTYNGAFAHCTSLKAVYKIPKTLKDTPGRIDYEGEAPFYGCSSLKTVTFADAILRIPSNLFMSSGLETVTIPETVVTIGEYSFCGTLLKSISIPDSVTEIGRGAFQNCKSLEKMETSNSSELMVIGEFAFKSCSLLNKVVFPESLINIKGYAFNDCTSLTEIKLPSKLQNLGTSTIASNYSSCVFAGCKALQAVYNIPPTLKDVPAYISIYENSCRYIFKDCTSLRTVTFANGITRIPAYLFIGCSGLKSIEIPDTVSTIGTSAFRKCASLSTISLPGSLSTVETYAFHDCSGLSTVNYPGNTEAWNAIDIQAYNDPLKNATKVYGNQTVYYVVAFDSMGGSDVDLIKVARNSKLSKPTNPTYLGKDFAGWYTTSALNTEWNFNNAVTKSMTLYAKWVQQSTELTVTFDANGGTPVPSSQKVIIGNKATEPSVPSRGGYSFDGWYSDSSFTTKWNFDDPVASNMTLYAKWLDDSGYTITFDSRGGSAVDSQHIEAGEKITEPTDPTRAGFKFLGWYKESTCNNKWDFSTEPTSNITLYAGWISATGFSLKVDNNGWRHHNYEGGGFEGRNDYRFVSNKADTYYIDLISGLPSFKIDNLLTFFNRDKWGGSCYGIAATMGLLYLEKLSLKQLTDGNATSYYSLQRPADDKKFMDVINYHHAAQFINNKYTTSRTDGKGRGIALKDFLKALYNKCKDKYPVLFCYGIPGESIGHAILAVNSEESSSGYTITLYDMNSYKESSGGEFMEMPISSDFGSFSFTDAGGHGINQNNYTYVKFADLGDIKTLSPSIQSAGLQDANENYTMLTLGSDATVTNAEGKTLGYSKGELSGTMAVHEVNPIASDDASELVVWVDNSSSFKVAGDSINASVGNSNGFMALESGSLKEAVLSFDNGIQMNGSDYDFKAYVQTDNAIEGNQKGLGSISGKATGNATVKKDGNNVKAATSGVFSNVTTTNYIGVDKYEEAVEGEVSEIAVDTTRTSIGEKKEEAKETMSSKTIPVGSDIYTVSWNSTISYNGTKHFNKGAKASTKSKSYDMDVILTKNGTEVPVSSYKVKFKNNMNATVSSDGITPVGNASKLPYFTISIKNDKAAKQAFKAEKFEFGITPVGISKENVIFKKIKPSKNGTMKISGMKYINPMSKKVSMKPFNASKGKGDYVILGVSGNSVEISGVNNYEGTMVLN